MLVVLALTFNKTLENNEKFFYKQKCKFDICSMNLSFFQTWCNTKTIVDIMIYKRENLKN